MTTVSVLATNLRTRFLRGGKAEQHNILSVNIDATQTTFVTSHEIGPISKGMRVSMDLEDMHVFAVDPNTKTITVERGAYGSTAVVHTAGDVILSGSNWTDFDILAGFNRVLGDLEGKGLFDVTSANLTYNSNVDGYDITGATSTLIDVIDIYSRDSGTSSLYWRRLDVGDWSLVSDADTSDFASGFGIVMRRPGVAYPGTTLRVTYRKRFGRLTALSEDVTTTASLDVVGEDLLTLGTAVDMLSSMPMARNDLSAQGDPRRAEEVPAGAWSQSPSRLARTYEKRVRDARVVLERRYPTRLRVQ